MPSYRNATVILPSPLVEGSLAHLRTLEGLDLHLPVAPGAAAQLTGARAQSGHLTVFVEGGVITGALTLPGGTPTDYVFLQAAYSAAFSALQLFSSTEVRGATWDGLSRQFVPFEAVRDGQGERLVGSSRDGSVTAILDDGEGRLPVSTRRFRLQVEGRRARFWGWFLDGRYYPRHEEAKARAFAAAMTTLAEQGTEVRLARLEDALARLSPDLRRLLRVLALEAAENHEVRDALQAVERGMQLVDAAVSQASVARRLLPQNGHTTPPA